MQYLLRELQFFSTKFLSSNIYVYTSRLIYQSNTSFHRSYQYSLRLFNILFPNCSRGQRGRIFRGLFIKQSMFNKQPVHSVKITKTRMRVLRDTNQGKSLITVTFVRIRKGISKKRELSGWEICPILIIRRDFSSLQSPVWLLPFLKSFFFVKGI